MNTTAMLNHTAYQEKYRSQRGQVALIILLIMVVVLTIGVSISSRTVMDVTLSRQEEEGGRVYQAAESGIEGALSQDLANDSLYTDDSFSGTITGIDNIAVDYTVARKTSLETRVEEGFAVEVDVTGAVDGNQLEVSWGLGDDCSSGNAPENASSLLIRIYKDVGGTITVRNLAYAACAYTDGYPTAGTNPGTDGYFREVTLTLQANDVMVRIQPNLNNTALRVAGVGWTLPFQYYEIVSQARNELGNESKAVQVARTLPTYPTVLDYVIYSGGSIAK
jgi:Tfp pilus assembly protein PilX